MVLYIKESLKIMKLKVMDITNGVMVDRIVELGKIIKCMDMGSLLGQMAECMKVNTTKIKNRVNIQKVQNN